MSNSIEVLIVGAGISGLTLANLLSHTAQKGRFRITMFETYANHQPKRMSIGGGIGLWPPSQDVLCHIPNFNAFLKHTAFAMPAPSYRDAEGHILAAAPKTFKQCFPVYALDREDLIGFLVDGLKNQADVRIIRGQKISSYQRYKNKIFVKTDDGQTHYGDLLIACDGIHSQIRKTLMLERGLPLKPKTDLGYTYFRANTQIPAQSGKKWWSVAFETWGTSHTQKHGRHEIRFGFVPLKPPMVFWFIAIKTRKGHPHLAPIDGVECISQATKSFLLELVRAWKPVLNKANDVAADYVELIELSEHILRTDIAKIANVEAFPWTSEDNRVILMGDATHATAPNIAQGAGLSIEDAACLTHHLKRLDYLHSLPAYEKERKKRAKTVQRTADFIASVGQVQNPIAKSLRNGFMRSMSYLFPKLQQHVFAFIVSISLGGSKHIRYWHPSALSEDQHQPPSILSRAFKKHHLLAKKMQAFKESPTGGRGEGFVSVAKPSFLARFIGKMLGLPKPMNQQPFYAEVINLSANEQRWNRIFGFKTPQQRSYATTQSTFCDFQRRVYLSEGFGGVLDNLFQFIYQINLNPDNSITYDACGITLFRACKLPLPSFLLPKSTWTETPTNIGWSFDGQISHPLLGTLLHYHGQFAIKNNPVKTNKRVIIAGGSGMIGQAVCLEFLQKGYDVYCLSRNAHTNMPLKNVYVRELYDDWSDLIDNNAIIINLSGANAGAKRWTKKVKETITQSRIDVIEQILLNINKAKEPPLKYLQASAAGFYGNAPDTIFTEESKPQINDTVGTRFRVNVCQEIEALAAQANCPVIQVRLGHVLANSGGLLPYLRWAGRFNISRMGDGEQYVPFVHINDVANALEFISQHDDFKEGAVNITAPNPCQNKVLLQALRRTLWLPGLPMPKWALHWLFGQSAVVLTDSERVSPRKLLERGFTFQYPTVQSALNGLQ